jgi:hypothetical protein
LLKRFISTSDSAVLDFEEASGFSILSIVYPNATGLEGNVWLSMVQKQATKTARSLSFPNRFLLLLLVLIFLGPIPTSRAKSSPSSCPSPAHPPTYPNI